jgi:hypothetical protein
MSQVIIYLDGAVLAQFESGPFETWLPLQRGEHQVWAEAIGADGKRVTSPEVSFQVLEGNEG